VNIAKHQAKSLKHLKGTVKKSLYSHLIRDRTEVYQSPFDKVLATAFQIITTYNYFTCLFWMGIEGYPKDIWYAIEIVTEVIMLFYVTFQILLQNTRLCKLLQPSFHMMKGQFKLKPIKIVKLLIIGIP
jgi:hypothetical protein